MRNPTRPSSAAFYAEAINARDATACDRLLTEGFVHNEEPRGRGTRWTRRGSLPDQLIARQELEGRPYLPARTPKLSGH
jgi:hypothetical protein